MYLQGKEGSQEYLQGSQEYLQGKEGSQEYLQVSTCMGTKVTGVLAREGRVTGVLACN